MVNFGFGGVAALAVAASGVAPLGATVVVVGAVEVGVAVAVLAVVPLGATAVVVGAGDVGAVVVGMAVEGELVVAAGAGVAIATSPSQFGRKTAILIVDHSFRSAGVLPASIEASGT